MESVAMPNDGGLLLFNISSPANEKNSIDNNRFVASNGVRTVGHRLEPQCDQK